MDKVDNSLAAAGLAMGMAAAGGFAMPYVDEKHHRVRTAAPPPDKAKAKRRAKSKAARKARKRNRR